MPSISNGTTFLSEAAPTMPHIIRSSFRFLHRPLPAWNGYLADPRDSEDIRRRILGQRRARAQCSAMTDSDRCDKLRVGADEDAVLDHRVMFVDAIVVAGDGPGTDVH